MIHLSAEAINTRSPYKVLKEDDNIFIFKTKYGIVYSAGFMQDTSFMNDGVYQFFLINKSRKKGRRDEDIYETVRVIIEEFFAQKETIMLYICDTTDGRQASRDRMFRAWFHSYVESASYSMYTESMVIDQVRYYSSILMRKDHPKLITVLSSFTNFFKGHTQE